MPRHHERTTLALRGTVAACTAQLDFPSTFAIGWARQWLRSGPGAMGVDPLASGVIRRALQVYVRHLEDPTTDPQQEACAVRLACSASTVDADAREGAWKRLEAHEAGEPMPIYLDALHGPPVTGALDMDALTERAEELAAQALRARRPKARTSPPPAPAAPCQPPDRRACKS